MVGRLAWLKDQGRDYRMAASLAKLFATEHAKTITNWAALLHGGSGVLVDEPIHRYPLDAWASALGEGASDVHGPIVSRQSVEWVEQPWRCPACPGRGRHTVSFIVARVLGIIDGR